MSAAVTTEVLHTTRIPPSEFKEYGVLSTSTHDVVIQWSRGFDSPSDEKIHATAIIAIVNINTRVGKTIDAKELERSGVVTISLLFNTAVAGKK